MQQDEPEEPTPPVPDFSMMSEEEQIAYAMQMSLSQPPSGSKYNLLGQVNARCMRTYSGSCNAGQALYPSESGPTLEVADHDWNQ